MPPSCPWCVPISSPKSRCQHSGWLSGVIDASRLDHRGTGTLAACRASPLPHTRRLLHAVTAAAICRSGLILTGHHHVSNGIDGGLSGCERGARGGGRGAPTGRPTDQGLSGRGSAREGPESEVAAAVIGGGGVYDGGQRQQGQEQARQRGSGGGPVGLTCTCLATAATVAAGWRAELEKRRRPQQFASGRGGSWGPARSPGHGPARARAAHGPARMAGCQSWQADAARWPARLAGRSG